jgi:hypothetical protein
MLFVAASVISALMLINVAAVAFSSWAMPLCFEPTVPSAVAVKAAAVTESIRKVQFSTLFPAGMHRVNSRRSLQRVELSLLFPDLHPALQPARR